jgi:hypothetical protein
LKPSFNYACEIIETVGLKPVVEVITLATHARTYLCVENQHGSKDVMDLIAATTLATSAAAAIYTLWLELAFF